jgi:hypothetical protein
MKILIYNTKTGLYLADGDQWVEKAAVARDFQHASVAIHYASIHNFADVEMTYAFPDPRYNFSTNIGANWLAREQS